KKSLSLPPSWAGRPCHAKQLIIPRPPVGSTSSSARQTGAFLFQSAPAMKQPRRQFLKTTLVASATTALPASLKAAAGATAGREYYELRSYRLKPGASHESLDGYLEKSFIPALNQRGINPVGAFTEIEVDKTAGTSKPK